MGNYHNSRIEVFKKLSDGTWDDTSIVLNYHKDIKVQQGIGKSIDTFEFTAFNPENELFEQSFDGDGSTTTFALTYYPSSVFLTDVETNSNLLTCLVDGTEMDYTSSASPGTGHYTISGSNLKVGTTPTDSTFNVKLRFDVISADDLVDIYVWKNSESYTNDDLLIEGVISEPGTDSNESARFVTVRGKGMIEAVLSALTFYKSEGEVKFYQVIWQLLSQVNNLNPNRKIYGVRSGEWTAVGNELTKSDGTDFPDITYSCKYKSAIEIIEEITSDKYTEDGQYIFWVEYDSSIGDGIYKFVCKAKSSESTDSLDYGEYSSVKPLLMTKTAKKVDDVVNFVIYNVGEDPDGVAFDHLYADFSSISSVGGRWLYTTETSNITPELVTREFEANSSYFPTDSNSKRTSNLPTLSGGTWGNGTSTWTFLFQARNSDTGSQTGGFATCGASTEDWVEVINEEAKWKGQAVARRLVELYSNPLYESESEMVFNTNFALGDVITHSSNDLGLFDKEIRIIELEHSFWQTLVRMKEDEKTLEVPE